MKKDQYFNLEVNFLSNDNIVRMMMELDAAQSLGIYMMLPMRFGRPPFLPFATLIIRLSSSFAITLSR